MQKLLALIIITVLACCAHQVLADVKLPAIFGDHMVLQRGIKVPFWGTADAAEKITVKAAGQEKSMTADSNGRWRVQVDPIEATDPIEVTVSGKNTITFTDVLIGEVWLCSGQSNMGFAVKRASNATATIKAANQPKIRLFTVGRAIKDEPQSETAGEWQVCSPETVGDFSAVAYFFGSALQQKLNQPVGLIESSWGGTRAEAWLPKPIFDSLKLPYEPEWTEQWLHPKKVPGAAQEPERPHEAPAVLYNGMIAPLAGYAIKGAVWYQGETNTAYPDQYHDVLSALIKSWRTAWAQGDFPFLVVQLPNLKNNRFWPTLRAAQAQVAKDVPNVGLAVTIDLGDPKDIHPKNKLPVGQRLALVAAKIAYGKDVPYSGPTFKSIEIDGSNAVISFDHVYDGLVSKGGDVQGFQVAGPDGKFVPAHAKIDGEKVVVSADSVPSPKVVRYAWENDPKCTLYNKADLPATPFEATVK
jgi:sialate O-acetylesterase